MQINNKISILALFERCIWQIMNYQGPGQHQAELSNFPPLVHTSPELRDGAELTNDTEIQSWCDMIQINR